MPQEGAYLRPLDIALIVLFMVTWSAVAIFFRLSGRTKNTIRKFMRGDRNLPIIPVAFSGFITYYASKHLLDSTELSYYYGFQSLYALVGHAIGICLSIFVYSPVFYQINAVTVNEYLEKRFGRLTRLIGSSHLTISLTLYSSTTLYSMSVIVIPLTGLSMCTMVLMSVLICVLYFSIGGVKSLVWINTIQALTLFTAIFILIIKGISDVGGVTYVLQSAINGGLAENNKFSLDPKDDSSFWSVALSNAVAVSYLFGLSQAHIQMASCCSTITSYKIALLLGGVLNAVMFSATVLCGIVIYASLGTCDRTLQEKDVQEREMLLPYFIQKHIIGVPGVFGIVISGIVSSTISTIASLLFALVFLTFQDFIVPLITKERFSEEKSVLVITFLTYIYGGLIAFTTFTIAIVEGSFLLLSLVLEGFVAIEAGMFTLGMLFTKPNEKGAVTGIVVAQLFTIWVAVGKYLSLKPSPIPPGVCVNFTKGIGSDNLSHVSNEIHNASWLLNTEGSDLIVSNETFRLQTSEIENLLVPRSSHIFPLYLVSRKLVVFLDFVITLCVGYVISLMTGPNEFVSPHYLSPVVRHTLQAVAETAVRSFRVKKDYDNKRPESTLN